MSGAGNNLGSWGLLGPAVFQMITACTENMRPYNSSPRFAAAAFGARPAPFV